jgi:hypothetical protein
MCISLLRLLPILLLAAAPVLVEAADGADLQPWVKRGVVITPGFAGPRSSFLVSAPSVVRLRNGRLRMYFWGSDSAQGTRFIFAAEAAAEDPLHWQPISPEPMLGPAPSGNIRDHGAAFPSVVPRDDGPWLMYYAAWGSWAPPGELPTRTGLAMSEDAGITWRVTHETVLPLGKRGSFDGGLTGGQSVLRTGKNEYLMWYTAGERYVPFAGENRSIVHTGFARSPDGIVWTKNPRPVISPREGAVDPFEAVTARPSVLKIDGVYHMWLGVYRMWPGAAPLAAGQTRPGAGGSTPEPVGYRMEYARSTDGIHWRREAGKPVFPLTPDGFDSRNQSYPAMVEVGDQLLMFYVGNRFGTTGIGLATLDKPHLH